MILDRQEKKKKQAGRRQTATVTESEGRVTDLARYYTFAYYRHA